MIARPEQKQAITHLSFTRLKNLADCPAALKAYIERDEPATKVMNEGSLLDCLLFTPEEMETRFYVIPKISRQSKAGKAEFAAHIEAAGNKIVVNEEQVADAKFLCHAISQNATVAEHGLLNPDFFKFQVQVNFARSGFFHRGVKDADGHRRDGIRCIWDLKRMGNTRGENLVRRQIRVNKYDLQAAIYCYELDEKNEHVEYYVIAVDNDGYVTPFRIGKDARIQARYEWNKLIGVAHRCNMEGLDAGPEFWAGPQGFFEF